MKWFDTIADKASHAIGHALALPVIALVIIVMHMWTGVDATNFMISVVSLALLVILQHTQNKDGMAIQAKLDAIIEGTPADSALVGLDLKTEKDILEARKS